MADLKMMSFSDLLKQLQQMPTKGFPPDSWYIIVVSSGNLGIFSDAALSIYTLLLTMT